MRTKLTKLLAVKNSAVSGSLQVIMGFPAGLSEQAVDLLDLSLAAKPAAGRIGLSLWAEVQSVVELRCSPAWPGSRFAAPVGRRAAPPRTRR